MESLTNIALLQQMTRYYSFLWLSNISLYIFYSCCWSVTQSCSTLCDPMIAACQDSQPCTISQSLLKLRSIELVMPSNHLIFCHPLFLLPSIFPSISIFSNESALRIRWAKYCSFSISPSNEYSGLISFRIHWFDFLAVQGSLKGILQKQSSKASILQCSVFFMVKLSHLHMTTGKTTALTRRTFVGKVMSLFFLIQFLNLSQLFFQRVSTF